MSEDDESVYNEYVRERIESAHRARHARRASDAQKHATQLMLFGPVRPAPDFDVVMVLRKPRARDRAVIVLRAGCRTLDALDLAVPERIANEDVGDARERLSRLDRAGAPAWKKAVAVWGACAWIVVNAAREVVRAFMGKKRERG